MLFPLKNRTIVLIVLAVTIIALVSIILGVYFGLTAGNSEEEFVSPAGVVANGIQCAQIGTDILRKGGTAADAAIATLFCEGILCPHSMGIGGGFLLTHYKRKTKTIETLIAREAAPLGATPDMFVGVDDITGILAVAVPGELKGYWELHQRYGLLSWRTLIEPSINLCRNGYIVSPHMANALRQTRSRILNSTDLTEIFINPLTLDVWQEGDIITRPKYADTLEIIASEGVDTLYKNGTIAQLLVQDIRDMGGIISYNDFLNYAAVWEPAIVSKLNDNKTLYTIPLPGSGHLLSFIMNILTNFIADESLTSHQRIIESFKYAYAKRTELGDPNFIDNIDGLLSNLTNPNYAEEIRNLILDRQTFTDPAYYGANFTFEQDQGTAHISVLAPNGDAVSVTSTINTYFGAKVISPNTGIILNDEMDDFSTPNFTNSFGVPSSPSNYIAPRKRPMSSMCPAIIIDENDNVQMVIGSAGGTQITTSVAYIILRHLIFKEDLNTAMEAARIHHQLMPMVVQYERDFNIDFINGLSGIGHEMQPVNSIATVIAIAIENNDITGKFDTRRGGSYSKF